MAQPQVLRALKFQGLGFERKAWGKSSHIGFLMFLGIATEKRQRLPKVGAPFSYMFIAETEVVEEILHVISIKDINAWF